MNRSPNFRLSARFPKEERYALTDQIRRSSLAVCSNVMEGFAKRRYEAVFKNSLNPSLGKAEIFEICGRYGVSSVEEMEARYRDGTLEEADSWRDLQRLDHLEYKRDRLQQLLEASL